MSLTSNIDIHRDHENDILYVMRGSVSDNTVNVHMLSNVVKRIDPKTDKAVGLIIHNFSKVAPDWNDIGEWRLMEIFDLFLDMINSGGKIAS